MSRLPGVFTPGSTAVVVMRHGHRADESDANACPTDPHLSEAGVSQSRAAAHVLRKFIPEDVPVTVYASPFSRTMESAVLLVDELRCGSGGRSSSPSSTAKQAGGGGPQVSRVVRIVPALVEVWNPRVLKTDREPAHVVDRAMDFAAFIRGDLNNHEDPAVSRALEQRSPPTNSTTQFDASTLQTLASCAVKLDNGHGVLPQWPEGESSGQAQRRYLDVITSVASHNYEQHVSATAAPTSVAVIVGHGNMLSAFVEHVYPNNLVYHVDFCGFVLAEFRPGARPEALTSATLQPWSVVRREGVYTTASENNTAVSDRHGGSTEGGASPAATRGAMLAVGPVATPTSTTGCKDSGKTAGDDADGGVVISLGTSPPPSTLGPRGATSIVGIETETRPVSQGNGATRAKGGRQKQQGKRGGGGGGFLCFSCCGGGAAVRTSKRGSARGNGDDDTVELR